MASIMNYAKYIHFSFVIFCQFLASYRRFRSRSKVTGRLHQKPLIFQESLTYKPTPFILTHDSGQKFQMTLCIRDLMMLFSQNESYWTIKMSFHYGRKLGIFPKGLTDHSGQKFQISFKPTFL